MRIPFHPESTAVNDIDCKRARLHNCGLALRAALSNGCPPWLTEAVHDCVTDLERLAQFNAPAYEVNAACAQAESLVEICRASSSRIGG